MRLADVDERGQSTFITSGVTRETSVVCWPTTYRVAAGHRLRVVVCDADFPRIWPGAEAEEFAVAGLEITIPSVDDDVGVAPDLPAVEPPEADGGPLWLGGDRTWTIARDPLRNGVEIVIGEEGALRTPNREHILELRQILRATVGADAASVEAVNNAVARMNSGEVVEVDVTAELKHTGLSVHAELRTDGATTWKRTWEAKAMTSGATSRYALPNHSEVGMATTDRPGDWSTNSAPRKALNGPLHDLIGYIEKKKKSEEDLAGTS